MIHLLDSLDPRVLGDKLKQARTARGLRQEDVAGQLGVARTTLVAIEKGERRVSARELKQMADLYGRQMSDWLGTEPAPQPLVPQFRMPARQVPLEEAKVREIAGELESLARDYLELESLTGMVLPKRYPPEYAMEVPSLNVEQRAEDVAAQERLRLGLGDGPIADLRSVLADSVGLRIFYLDLPSAVGGLYAYSDDVGGCIAINRKHPPARATWSLAHEYGHFLTTRRVADVNLWNDEPWGKLVAERFADSFAEQFLMPRSGVNRTLGELVSAHGKGVTVADVMALCHQFRVSAEAMFRRLENLRRLPPGTWDGLRARKFRPDQARETLGLVADPRRESLLPFRYRLLAREAYEDGELLTEGQLARFLRMDRVAARLELDRLRSFADQPGEEGFEAVELDYGNVIVPA